MQKEEKNLESVNYFYKIKNYKIKVEIYKKFFIFQIFSLKTFFSQIIFAKKKQHNNLQQFTTFYNNLFFQLKSHLIFK